MRILPLFLIFEPYNYSCFRLIFQRKTDMVLALISYSSTSRLMKTCDVAKLICNTRNLSWQKYSHDRVITKITKANQPHAYVPSRHLGWLLAPKLKPHQKGYDRQQKMYFRSKVLFVIFSWMVLYYGYINGYIHAYIHGPWL